jgi:hypothetical protein
LIASGPPKTLLIRPRGGSGAAGAQWFSESGQAMFRRIAHLNGVSMLYDEPILRNDIFLSHHSSDKAWVERLATHIEMDRDGPPLKVFFDKWDIPHGADIPATLEVGMQISRYVGVVLSPEALSSDWVGLKRSTAIFADPRANRRRLIPASSQNVRHS